MSSPNEDQQSIHSSNSLAIDDNICLVRYDEFLDTERELLIDIIREHPTIWDANHEDNGKRNRMNEAYAMVAERMNEATNGQKAYPVEVLKRAWKSLRENYSYYVGKRRNTIKYANDNSNIKFKFYNNMSFLTKPPSTISAANIFSSYEECISMLANNSSSATGSINNDEPSSSSTNNLNGILMDLQAASPNIADPLPQNVTPQSQKRQKSPIASGVSAKRVKSVYYPQHGSDQNGHSNGTPSLTHLNGHYQNNHSQASILPLHHSSQLIPCALAINSTNSDLLQANLSLEARQFRNELLALVRKYEDILIEHEKERKLNGNE